MRLKHSVSLILFVAIMGGCAATKTSEQNSLPTSTATLMPTTEILSSYSDESLAEAMMQVYPDDGSVDYIVMKNNQFVFGEGVIEIEFEFLDIDPDSIANLTTDGFGLEEVTSPNGRLRAFVACKYEHCQDRLFVENLANSQIFEIVFSMRMNWRPLSKLMWIDDDILAFGQSSNPHYGFRFAVDVNQKEHLLTLMIADECFISGNLSC